MRASAGVPPLRSPVIPKKMSVRAFSTITCYSATLWERLGRKAKARMLLRELLVYARKLAETPAEIPYFATSLPTMLLFDNDIQFRQQTVALFLKAQAHLGLGNEVQVRSLLKTVLKRDPNHAFAPDLLEDVTQRANPVVVSQGANASRVADPRPVGRCHAAVGNPQANRARPGPGHRAKGGGPDR